MKQPVLVLYDFSAMGPVVENQVNYTGVQRVVHEVAAGLATRPDVHLTLYGGAVTRLCRQFVAAEPRLWRQAFTSSSLSHLMQQGLARLVQLTGQSRSLPAKVSRRILYTAIHALSRLQARLAPSDLAKYDVYHTPVYAFPPILQQVTSIKKFLTVYDLSPIKLPQFSQESILREYRQLYASLPADAYYLCISENTKKEWCEQMNVSPTRCFVTPLAAGKHFTPCTDQDKLASVRLRYQLPQGRYYLSVSTLEPRKNLVTVIQAFQQLLRQTQDENLYLVLVGKRGWKEDAILKASDGLEVRQKIIFTGYVAEEDLAAIYSGAMAFVYMSFYEGFGLPPLEAMQCGVPTITSNTSSLPEVVGKAGIMLDPEDRDGLCAAMQTLRDDESLRLSLRTRALQQASCFTWARCVDATLAAYRQALTN